VNVFSLRYVVQGEQLLDEIALSGGDVSRWRRDGQKSSDLIL